MIGLQKKARSEAGTQFKMLSGINEQSEMQSLKEITQKGEKKTEDKKSKEIHFVFSIVFEIVFPSRKACAKMEEN